MSTLHERSNAVISRRAILARRAAACGTPTGLAAAESLPSRAEPRVTSSCFLLGLNSSTIRCQKMSIVDEIALASGWWRRPLGATDRPIDPLRVAVRYRTLLELGDQMGVVPQGMPGLTQGDA